jgi:hypothetical protein
MLLVRVRSDLPLTSYDATVGFTDNGEVLNGMNIIFGGFFWKSDLHELFCQPTPETLPHRLEHISWIDRDDWNEDAATDSPNKRKSRRGYVPKSVVQLLGEMLVGGGNRRLKILSPRMATACIDYFATLGKKNGPLLCQNMSSFVSEKPVHPSIVWNSAITDINIIFYGRPSPFSPYSADPFSKFR